MGRNHNLEELLSGQTCPLATGSQLEEAVALPSPCELQPGLLEKVGSGLEVALALRGLLALHGCRATEGKGKGASMATVSSG